MVALPTSFPSGHEPSADEYQAILDLMNAMTGLPAPTQTASNGTATSGTTETRDAVLGDYSFTVPAVGAAWRYEVVCVGRLQTTVADDLYECRVRDGGASTPSSSSTQVGGYSLPIHGTGGNAPSFTLRNTWVPGSGTHTLSLFVLRTGGSGVATPLAPSGLNRELFVRLVGTN